MSTYDGTYLLRDAKGGVTIGTANFTENQVLGYLYAATLEAAGVKTRVRPNLGTREILIPL